MCSIILNMIVKNESKVIERCLDNVKWIDGVVISDTGSTDNTEELIYDWIKRNDKVGTVVHNEWKNFGHNRTEALREAKKWCIDNNYDLTKTFFMLIDADMVFPGGASIRDKIDQGDVWDVRQQNPSMVYSNLRFVRASIDIVCKCPTHEYYDILTPDAVRKSFEDDVIQDIGDGGAKSDKAERDIRLLKEALTLEPKNCRYWFYLANTYRDTKDFANAILAYNTRIEVGGWFEETYCAMLYKGDCHLNLNQNKEAIEVWLDAYNVDPLRSEALYRLACYYRTISRHNTSMLFVDKGLKMQIPSDRLLFIERNIYEYKFLYELSICAYYLKDFPRGRLACQRLLDMEDVPEVIKESTRRNLTFYNT